jgi:ATP-dependent Clp protease protease subunit
VSNRTNPVVVVSLVLLALAVVGVVVGQAVLLGTLLAISTTAESTVEDSIESFIDQEIDAGHAAPVLDEQDPLFKGRKIFLHHDINSRAAADVVMRLLALNDIDPVEPINLYISTQGGWSDNTFAIVDTMRMIDAPVNTWAVGGCYSAGALVLSAGTGRRYATENSVLMIHTNLDDSLDEFSYDRLALQRYERLWKETAGLPADWFPMTTDRRYYLDPDEAVAMGIVDEIVPVWGTAQP